MVGSTRALALLVVLLSLGGCSAEPVDGVGKMPDDPLDYMSYSCWGEEREYRVGDPYGDDQVPEGAWSALERVQRSNVSAVGPTEVEEWEPVVVTERAVVFLYELGTGRFPYSEVEVHRGPNGGWSFAGSGDCQLWATPRDGWASAEWSLTEDPEPEAREIQVLAKENGCSSGRKLAPDDFRSFIHYEDGRISVAVYSKPLEADFANCIGNPSTKVTIDLDEPVGDREIFDVGRYPSQLETKSGEQ